MATFKERLNEIIKERNITARDVAYKTHITEATISRYLSGKMEPKFHYLHLIANALNVSPIWLMGCDVNNEKEIGNLIRQKREDLKLTIDQVSTFIGVSKSTVSRWETGDIKKIKRSHLFLLANILHLPIETLLGLENKEVENAELVLKRNELISQIEKIKDTNKLDDVMTFIKTFILKWGDNT